MRRDFSQQLGQRIIIPGKSKSQYINIAEITHINSEDSVVTTHTSACSVSACKQLKEFENELETLGFVRINRSTLVNEAHISSYTGGEKKIVEMTNGQQFEVSRRKARHFK